MINDRDIFAEYFSWLLSIVGDGGGRMDVLTALYNTDFYVDPRLPDDQNRVLDALQMRDSFINNWVCEGRDGCSDEVSYDFITMPASVLEVFVAVSIRCEDEIMQDEELGNRTKIWFWGLLEWFGLDQNAGNIEKFLGRDLMKIDQKRRKRRSIWGEMCNFLNKMG